MPTSPEIGWVSERLASNCTFWFKYVLRSIYVICWFSEEGQDRRRLGS